MDLCLEPDFVLLVLFFFFFFFFNPDGFVKNWFLKKEIESSGDGKTDSQSLRPGPLHSVVDVVTTPPTVVSLSVITGIVYFFFLSRSVWRGVDVFIFLPLITWHLASLTRDRTHTPCSGSAES